MAKQELYIPTRYIEKAVVNPVIFLAGPIQGALDWQSKAAEIISNENPHILIANPRREYLDGTFNYTAQVDWETFHLNRAGENGAILFWLPKEETPIPGRAYAQTTRVEFGEALMAHKFVSVPIFVGMEEGYSGAKYVIYKTAQYGVPLFKTLEDTVTATVHFLDRSIINNPLPSRNRIKS